VEGEEEEEEEETTFLGSNLHSNLQKQHFKSKKIPCKKKPDVYCVVFFRVSHSFGLSGRFFVSISQC